MLQLKGVLKEGVESFDENYFSLSNQKEKLKFCYLVSG